MSRFFVYGSLLSEEVLNILLGRVPRTTTATLRGFRRYALRNKDYPMMVKTDNGEDVVYGKVLRDITDKEEMILDAFETDEYERISVSVSTPTDNTGNIDTTEMVYTYCAAPHLTFEFDGEWDYIAFKERKLSSFLLMCTEFKANDCKF